MPQDPVLARAAKRDRGGDVHLRAVPQLREYEVAVDRIVADRPQRLLDWGCGFGQLSSMLRARGLDVTSFDWHPGVDEITVRPLERYPEVEATFSPDPVALPYDDDSFDAVLSMGVLEHVHDPEGSLDEIHRVLQPGGRLYVYKLPNRFSYLEKIAKRAGLYWHGMLEHDRVYTPSTARALVERHGFDVEQVGLANMLPLTLTSPAVNRAGDAIWSANRALTRVPGLKRAATNVELIARRVP